MTFEFPVPSTIRLQSFSGFEVRGFFYNVLGSVDPDLASSVHAGKTLAPFSVTPVLLERGGREVVCYDRVEPGLARFTFALARDDVARAVYRAIQAGISSVVIANHALPVSSIRLEGLEPRSLFEPKRGGDESPREGGTPSSPSQNTDSAASPTVTSAVTPSPSLSPSAPSPRVSPYSNAPSSAEQTGAAKGFELLFITPTYFRATPLDLAKEYSLDESLLAPYRFIALPDPILMFRGLVRTWREFVGGEGLEDFVKWVEAGGVLLSGYPSGIFTKRVYEHPMTNKWVVGFVGKARFSFSSKLYDQKMAEKALALLKFGEIMGVGAGRTSGLGRVKLLQNLGGSYSAATGGTREEVDSGQIEETGIQGEVEV